jgi:DNA-binding NarL/FixJ family response regulator
MLGEHEAGFGEPQTIDERSGHSRVKFLAARVQMGPAQIAPKARLVKQHKAREFLECSTCDGGATRLPAEGVLASLYTHAPYAALRYAWLCITFENKSIFRSRAPRFARENASIMLGRAILAHTGGRQVLPVSILIVDDHPLLVEALKLVISNTFPSATIAEATSIETARGVLDKQPKFDLVLLDLSMPGTRGLDGLIELRSRYPKLPIVVVSALEDPRIIHEVMQCGAAGFISKSTRGAELGRALEEVMAGSVVLPKGYQPPPSTPPSGSDLTARIATLTPQQVRVLQMLRQGLLNKQIAYDLGVGETTIKAHVSEILRKLKVSSRTQAVIEAAKIDFDAIIDRTNDSAR